MKDVMAIMRPLITKCACINLHLEIIMDIFISTTLILGRADDEAE
jgi:hypothetical protein